MQISAELRWFWEDTNTALTRTVKTWLDSGEYMPGGGTPRNDVYVLQRDQAELGIKQRGEKLGLEIKGLISVLRPINNSARSSG